MKNTKTKFSGKKRVLEGGGKAYTYDEIMKNQQQANQAGSAVEGAVGMIPVWGQLISGASKLAGNAFGADEYGDYEEGVGGKTRQFFNKSFNMKEGISGLQDTFKRPSVENVANQLSLGLIGKSSREKDAETAKQLEKDIKLDNSIRKNTLLSNQMMQSIPKYKAPVYGEKGLKIKDMDKSKMKIEASVDDIIRMAYGGKTQDLAEGGTAEGPSHSQGGIGVTQGGQETNVEIEGGERVFSKEDTAMMEKASAAIVQAMDSGDQEGAMQMAAELGMAVVQMIAAQEQNQQTQEGGEEAAMNEFASGQDMGGI